MKRILHKFIASAIMLIALQITLTAQPVGSQIKTDTSGHISYWNGVDAWIPVAPGLPGQTLKFTAGVPSWVNNPNGITTTAVSNITGNTALSGGNVISDGGAKITTKGVCWSTSPNPTIADNKTIDGSGIGSFTTNISGLNSGATYYIRAYATNSTGTAYGNEVNISLIYKVYDIDGNAYDTVHIGTQVWLKQNLNTSRYKNGTVIPNVTNNTTWAGLNTGARCYYNNDSVTYSSTYGALYNWYTVNTGNLCPIGWHVPSDADWTTLTTYLGGESIAGGKLKEAGIAHWSSPNSGAGNESNFSAIASGTKNGYFIPIDYVSFYGKDTLTMYWSSSDYNNENSWIRQLSFNNINIQKLNYKNNFGFSVRCIKDIQTNNNPQIFDIDGNAYDTIHIGTQVWLKQNLNTSRYNNGTAIPNVTDNATWGSLSTGARCYYNNDSVTYSSTYGALYNYHTVNTGNLCPTGWHVPTNSEWTTLITYLGGESIAGGKLKEAGLAHWQSPNANATNETGFTALPCGNRFYDPGTYFNIGEYGYWWCSAETGTVSALYMGMNYNSGYVGPYASYNGYKFGVSVRCLKD